MRSRLEITTDRDGRYITQPSGDGWVDALIRFVSSVSERVSESDDPPHIRSRLAITTESCNDTTEWEGDGWAENTIQYIKNFSAGAETKPETTTSLEITTDRDGRYTTRPSGDGWVDALIRFVGSVSERFSRSDDPPYITSRLTITNDIGKDVTMWDGDGWAEAMTQYIQDFSAGTETRPAIKASHRSSSRAPLSEPLSVRERLESFLKYEYPHVWFTSSDVQTHYGRIYGQINLSTVSTYLARMYNRELLERRGNRMQREYRVQESEIPELTLPIIQNAN
ncbi:MAG: hypothetical protein U9N36_02895 [Euryarchaeota archaeon]|nr:hypothetical protein [Euryarchaeota archaeon]